MNLLPAETALPLPSGDTINLPSFPSKGGNLHGGPSPHGWDEKLLKRVDIDRSELFSPKEVSFLRDQSAAIWSLTSPDGEGGHIGTVYCEIAFVTMDATVASEIGQIIVVYRAKVMDRSATALNLTHHWGFNLGASAVANGQHVPARAIGIQDHALKVMADEILNIDPLTSRPNGTALDLSSPTAIAKDFRNGKTIGKVGEGYPVGTGMLGQGALGDGYCDFWIFNRKQYPAVIEASEKNHSDVFSEIAQK